MHHALTRLLTLSADSIGQTKRGVDLFLGLTNVFEGMRVHVCVQILSDIEIYRV